MALLVAYTHKGIKVVHVPFDEEFCKVMEATLYHFYRDAFFPVLKKKRLSTDTQNVQ